MADYQVVYQRKDLQTFAPNAPIEVEEVGFILPAWDNLYAQVAVPYFNWLDDQAASLIQPMADGIDAEMQRPEIAGMAFEQDISANGNLLDLMIVVVQYVPDPPRLTGPMTTEVRVPTYGFLGFSRDVLVDIPIGKALASLKATAALT